MEYISFFVNKKRYLSTNLTQRVPISIIKSDQGELIGAQYDSYIF